MQVASIDGPVGAGKLLRAGLFRITGSVPAPALACLRGIVASLLSGCAHKTRHRPGHVVENGDPLREVLLAAGREAIDSFRRPSAGDIPLGSDAVVLLQLPQGLVEGGGFDGRIGQRVFPQLRRKLIPIRSPLLLEQETAEPARRTGTSCPSHTCMDARRHGADMFDAAFWNRFPLALE
jgi:hypothetical protein